MVGCEIGDGLIGLLVFGDGGGDYGGIMLFCRKGEGFRVIMQVSFVNSISFSFKKGLILLVCCSSMLSNLSNMKSKCSSSVDFWKVYNSCASIRTSISISCSS